MMMNDSKIFSFEIAFPNKPKLHRKHPWMVLYKDNSFCPDTISQNLFKQELSVEAMFVNGSRRNEQHL
jgi:hypothetical protein